MARRSPPRRRGELRSELGLPLDAASQRVLFGGWRGRRRSACSRRATTPTARGRRAAPRRVAARRRQAMDRLLVILDDAVRLGDATGARVGQVVPSASMAGPVAGALERLAHRPAARHRRRAAGRRPARRPQGSPSSTRRGWGSAPGQSSERAPPAVADPRGDADPPMPTGPRAASGRCARSCAVEAGPTRAASPARSPSRAWRAADGDDAVRVARLRSTVAEREGDRQRGERLRRGSGASPRIAWAHACTGGAASRRRWLTACARTRRVDDGGGSRRSVSSPRGSIRANRRGCSCRPPPRRGRSQRAFELARAALARDGRTEVVEVVELAATRRSRERISRRCTTASAAALGRFGRRR